MNKNTQKKNKVTIDDLAIMVARGFDDVKKEFEEVRKEMATKQDLEGFATKQNLEDLEGRFNIKVDYLVGEFRKDSDLLSTRVKKIETVAFK